MRYLFGGLLSLSLIACHAPSFDICGTDFEFNRVEVVKATTRVADNSREATVKVFSFRPEGKAFGTGTVFKYKGQVVILTAAHVISDTRNIIVVDTGYQELLASVVYMDSISDLAVITVSGDLDIKPIPLRPVRERNVKIGTDVLYSGFPNDVNLLTIEGQIAGLHHRGFLYMHSYGWSGASGSAVFDDHGRIVGVLIALDVGTGLFGVPHIVEDVVIVTPVWKLNFKLLDLSLGL
jgi:S1-C subfamily serine protease